MGTRRWLKEGPPPLRGPRVGYVPGIPWLAFRLLVAACLLLLPWAGWVLVLHREHRLAEQAYLDKEAQLPDEHNTSPASSWDATELAWEELYQLSTARNQAFVNLDSALSRGGSLGSFLILLLLILAGAYCCLRWSACRIRRILVSRGYEWVKLEEAMEISWGESGLIGGDFPPAEEAHVLPGFTPDVAGLTAFAMDWKDRRKMRDSARPTLLANRLVGRLGKLEALSIFLFIAAMAWAASCLPIAQERRRHAEVMWDALDTRRNLLTELGGWMSANDLEEDPYWSNRATAQVEVCVAISTATWDKHSTWGEVYLSSVIPAWLQTPAGLAILAGLLGLGPTFGCMAALRRLRAGRILRLLRARGYDWVDLMLAVRLAETVKGGWGRDLPSAEAFDASGLPCTARGLVAFEQRNRAANSEDS